MFLKLLSNFGLFLAFLYCLALGFSVYEVGLQKTLPWLFCGLMMVNIYFALKTKNVLKEAHSRTKHY
jgi:hypothetical protein